MMIKRILQRLILVLFGLFIGLLFGEGVARILYPLPSDLNTADMIQVGMPPTYIQYVDRMPWSNSITKYEIEGEYSTVVSINDKGLRGPEIPYEKAEDEFRILYIGDSFVKAVQVEFEEIVYHQLEQLFQAENQADNLVIKVIGAGESGWGTDQAYQYYRHEGYKFQPDLVIYQFVPNDVPNNLRSKFYSSSGLRQHFALKNGKLITRDITKITERPTYRYEITLHRQLLLASRLYALMRDYWRGGEISFLAQPVYRQVNPVFDEVPPQLFIYEGSYSASIETAWQLTETILAEWSRQVQKDGATLMVVSGPGRWAVYEEDWQKLPQLYPELAPEFSSWNRDKPDQYLTQITSRHNIPYLSLTAAFRTYAENNSQPLYFSQDGHWRARGHTQAAQAIFEWLSKSKLLS